MRTIGVPTVRDSLWIGPALAAVFAAAICAVAYVVGTGYDADVGVSVSEDTLVTVLALFASSMLTVATFSLSAITSSAAAVATSTTPRAALHVITDARGRLALSSFVAAFVYSVVGILSLVALRFGELGRLLLFVGLIVIVAVVLIAFIAWVDHVLKLGRQQHTLMRLLDNATRSLSPDTVGCFGAHRWDDQVPADAVALHPTRAGRVLGLDVAAIQRLAAEREAEVVVAVRPGDTVEPSTPALFVRGDDAHRLVDECGSTLLAALEVDSQRTQDQDVRFSVMLLGETADRALSPGVNDPGTAIVVLDLLLEFFADWREIRRDPATVEIRHDRVWVPPLTADELVGDAFGPIARDGAAIVEVGVRLQKSLAALARWGDEDLARAATDMSRAALEFTRAALVLDVHREAVAAVAPGAVRFG